jgi:glucose-6-phosphate 1-epimerase
LDPIDSHSPVPDSLGLHFVLRLSRQPSYLTLAFKAFFTLPPFPSMERKHKPASIPVSPNVPQPTIDLTDNVLTARLPSGDSCVVYLYGATVTSWKTSNGTEQLFLSKAAALDGSKPIRGGVPLVFPVFGPPPKDHSTSSLPQHGFARNSCWEFLGKSSSESLGKKADDSVKLDFGLSTGMLDESLKKKWPYEFGLVYSVTLGRGRLECQMHVQNKGKEAFEFQCLFHTYLQIKVSLK